MVLDCPGPEWTRVDNSSQAWTTLAKVSTASSRSASFHHHRHHASFGVSSPALHAARAGTAQTAQIIFRLRHRHQHPRLTQPRHVARWQPHRARQLCFQNPPPIGYAARARKVAATLGADFRPVLDQPRVAEPLLFAPHVRFDVVQRVDEAARSL